MSFFGAKGSSFTKKKGGCCPDQDIFGENVAFEQRGSDWFIIITNNDGSSFESIIPPAVFSDINVSELRRIPNPTNDPALFYTIEIVETDGSTYPLDLQDLFNSIASEELIENTIIVSKNGDDVAAIASLSTGNFDQHIPFANPTVAIANASFGTRVEVEAGVYTIGGIGSGADLIDDGIQYIGKNGVVLDMMPGAKIEFLPSSTTTTFFQDNGEPADFRIEGEGIFVFGRSIDTSLGIANESTTLYWEYRLLDSAVRFRWQLFSSITMKGNVIQRSRGMISTRVASAVLGGTTVRKKLILEGDTWEQVGFSNYDQLEIGFIQNVDVSITYKSFKYNNGSGGIIRFRALNKTNKVDLYIGHLYSDTNPNIPFLYSDTDDSYGTRVLENVDVTNRLVRYLGIFDPVERITQNLVVNGISRDGQSNNSIPFVFLSQGNKQIQVLLNINVEESTINSTNGSVVFLRDSPHIHISGYIYYASANHSVIRISPLNPIPQGFLKDLIISAPNAIASIFNISTTIPAQIKVVNTHSNLIPVSTANAGVNQLIESINQDPSI